MGPLAGYLLLAFCVTVHVGVLLWVITDLRGRRRVAGPCGTDHQRNRTVVPSGNL